MPDKSLGEVFIDELGDTYDAEKQLVHAMPKLIQRVKAESLRDALRMQMGQSRRHVASLERAFELMSELPRRKSCNAMGGLLAESECLMAESSREPVRDSAILAAVQKIEHYEIATYTTLREWAQQLGQLDVSTVLQQVLDEAIAADKTLSHLALTLDNEAARAE